MSVSIPKSLDAVTAQQHRPTKDSAPAMLLDAKDRRTYEHIRQRVKKAADTVKMRAQKTKRSNSPRRLRFNARRQGGAVRLDEDDVFDAVLIDSVNRGDAHTQLPPSSRVDVKLSDLVMTRLPHKRNDSDFEVVPHIRSVIVLDDVGTRDVSVDEPWEHIYGEDDLPVKAPSYATVLSSNK